VLEEPSLTDCYTQERRTKAQPATDDSSSPSYRQQTNQLRRTESHPSTDDDELVIRAQVDELTAAATRVVEYADYWLTRQDFRRLLWWLFGAGTPIAIGIVLFSTATSQHNQATAVTKPMAVEDFLTEVGREIIGKQLTAGLPS
jgi:hypothetical protein